MAIKHYPRIARHQTGNIRAVRPTGPITTPQQALAAWKRMLQYRELEWNANESAHRTGGGTHTNQTHHRRREAYSDVAAEWETALEAWLTEQAASPNNA